MNSNTYSLQRKLLTIHSEDRDKVKYPNINEFRIRLPEELNKIHSMRLVEISLPKKVLNISNDYQNTKFYITNSATATQKEITIPNGTYTNTTFASTIKTKINETTGLSNYDLSYDELLDKFLFGNTDNSFSLDFNKQSTFTLTNNKQPPLWTHPTEWGLGAILGFDKKQYKSAPSSTASTTVSTQTLPSHYLWSPNTSHLRDNTIYMDVNKFNSYDELYPFDSTNPNASGKVNSAFAKIPVSSTNNVSTSNNLLQNLVHFEPPLERLSTLEFRFRYHNGCLVEFTENIDFTIEVNYLNKEIPNPYQIRIPHTYNL